MEKIMSKNVQLKNQLPPMFGGGPKPTKAKVAKAKAKKAKAKIKAKGSGKGMTLSAVEGNGKPGAKTPWPEEAIPGSDYLERLMDKGPRPGESLHSFRGRLGRIGAQRSLWLDLAKELSGNITACCVRAGVNRWNLENYLPQMGLVIEDLKKFANTDLR